MMLGIAHHFSTAEGSMKNVFVDKNPKIQKFFNCFSNNKLVLSILSKTPQFSHQMRKFTLIREACFFKAETP